LCFFSILEFAAALTDARLLVCRFASAWVDCRLTGLVASFIWLLLLLPSAAAATCCCCCCYCYCCCWCLMFPTPLPSYRSCSLLLLHPALLTTPASAAVRAHRRQHCNPALCST
jgi:hypothetical protein